MGPTSTRTSSARSLPAVLVLLACGLLLLPGWLAVVTGQESDAPVEVTEATCLMCHSDRPGNVEFTHRTHTADLGGCVVCHGDGSEHALSRGAPGTIINPKKVEGSSADRACLLCHSDFTAPDHFTPAPGKERCVDCHGIHEAEAAPLPAEAATPGRPPLRFSPLEEEPETDPSNRYYAPGLPPAPPGDLRVAGIDLTGAVRAGFRYNGTRGNDRLADQDLGYDTGFRLFDLRLDARSSEHPNSGVHLEASGIDDPVERYGLDARLGDDWSFEARADRKNLVYHTSGADPFDYSSRREDLSMELAWTPDSPFRITAGVDFHEKEARRVGARYLATGVFPATQPIDEGGGYAFLRLDGTSGPLHLSLSQGYRWNQIEDGLRTPSPGSVGQPNLFHEQETDFRAPVTTAAATWKATDDVHVDAKVIWSPIRSETDTDTLESGTLSGSTFTEQVFGDVEADRSYLRGEVGATWFARPDLVVAARFEGLNDLEDLDADFRTISTAPAGQNPSTVRSEQDVERDQRRWRFAAEADYAATDWAEIRGGFEWSREEFDVEENGIDRLYDTNVYGPIVGLRLERGEDLDFDVLYRHIRVTDPFTEIGTADRDQARARVNWTPEDRLTLSWYFTRRLSANDRHDTRVLSWSVGTRASLDVVEDVHLEAGYDFERFDSETDAIRFIGGTPVLGEARFRGSKHGVSIFGRVEVSSEARLSLALNGWRTFDDFESDYLDVLLGGEYDVTRQVTTGLDLRFTSFTDDDFSLDEYDNYLAEIWMEFRF